MDSDHSSHELGAVRIYEPHVRAVEAAALFVQGKTWDVVAAETSDPHTLVTRDGRDEVMEWREIESQVVPSIFYLSCP